MLTRQAAGFGTAPGTSTATIMWMDMLTIRIILRSENCRSDRRGSSTLMSLVEATRKVFEFWLGN